MRRRNIALIACAALTVAAMMDWLWQGQSSARPPTVTAPPVVTPSVPPIVSPSPDPVRTPALYDGFELPLKGATGYATIELNLRSEPDTHSERLSILPPGTAFQIVREEGAYWRVIGSDFSGYVAHRYCMVNLPDVLPSVIYDNTNSYASKILTSGKMIPGISGEPLYENAFYNPRLQQKEFIMPVLYEMAKKIGIAQQAALQNGESLKIYESYRPYATQRKVVNALNALAAADSEVYKGISAAPWKVSWFASQGISNHQRGCAIDVSLVRVERTEQRVSGSYEYTEVTGFSEYAMPTAMHELSIAAAAFQTPVSSQSKTAWRSASSTESMNSAARKLQQYCTDAGLTPLASEWWHFNDLDAYAHIKANAGSGDTILKELYSTPPDD